MGSHRPDFLVVHEEDSMFTGLVQDCAKVVALEQRPDGLLLKLITSLEPRDLAVGASVCCNGVCLTVLESRLPESEDLAGQVMSGDSIHSDKFRVASFFVGPTTAAKTQLARLRRDDRVNLEPSLRVGDSLGGHHVSGHVDGCAQVLKFDVMEDGAAWELLLLLDDSWMDWIVEHGSVAVRGTSLTVAAVDRQARTLSIMLIPHTLAATNLVDLKVGSRVEIEFDMQIKALVQTARRILPDLMRQARTVPPGHSHD